MYTEKSHMYFIFYFIQLKGPEKEVTGVDIRDMMTSVEAVYSDDEDTPKPLEPDIRIQQPEHLFPFSCEYCPNKFSNRGALWQHTVPHILLKKHVNVIYADVNFTVIAVLRYI